jgi:hypothetical protein
VNNLLYVSEVTMSPAGVINSMRINAAAMAATKK